MGWHLASIILAALVFHLALFMEVVVVCADFSPLFLPNWAPDHIFTQNNQILLTLDNVTGCGFESRSKYLFGKTSAQVKLIAGDSAGTVTAFYMSSQGRNHDELDFEFLGNVSGEPYLVQTNVYVNGTGNREQRHKLWFDPTTDFHTYSFFWNHRFIVFLIDEIPIRIFANKEKKDVPFPKTQPMGIHGSLWNADDWATQGGRIKTNWSNAPFVSTFQLLDINACELLSENDDVLGKCGKLGQFWWDKPSMNKLNKKQRKQLKWVLANHLVYDYCKDKTRFMELPKECVI